MLTGWKYLKRKKILDNVFIKWSILGTYTIYERVDAYEEDPRAEVKHYDVYIGKCKSVSETEDFIKHAYGKEITL